MLKPKKISDDIRTPLEEMLREYRHSAGADLACAIRDLLTELIHLCDEGRVDFGDRIRAAREVYRQERAAGLAQGGEP